MSTPPSTLSRLDPPSTEYLPRPSMIRRLGMFSSVSSSKGTNDPILCNAKLSSGSTSRCATADPQAGPQSAKKHAKTALPDDQLVENVDGQLMSFLAFLCLSMSMAKYRIIYDDDDDDSNPVPADVKKSKRSPKQVDAPTGMLLNSLSHDVLHAPAKPSKMDLAMQGEDINPMAPCSQDTSGASLRNSQGMSTPAVFNPSDSEARKPSPASFFSSQPMFSRAAPGHEFSFRIPASAPQTQAPPHKCFSAANSTASSRTSMPPASLFSGRSLSVPFTAPTSRASSVCSSSGRGTYSQVIEQQSLPSQTAGYKSTHPQFLVTSSSLEPSGPGHCVSNPSDSLPQSLQFGDFNEPEPDLPRSTARLGRTTSFYHLPLSMDRVGHSISAAPHVGDKGSLPQIDEASPSEDERFAE
ncbi:hypothetical protein OG21DRAFT_1489344 [Imleria badia]|nr:hypothetical protein OG21DRAFT_1489344 [Imleria badia]